MIGRELYGGEFDRAADDIAAFGPDWARRMLARYAAEGVWSWRTCDAIARRLWSAPSVTTWGDRGEMRNVAVGPFYGR